MVVLADIHLGKLQDIIEKFGLPSRLYDLNARVREAIDFASKKKSCLVMAGDVFDSHTPSPNLISIFFSWLGYAANKKVLVYIIPGNHDCGMSHSSMSYLYEICVKNENFFDTNATVFSGPRLDVIENMRVAFLPHVPRALMSPENYQEWAMKCLSSNGRASIDVVIGHAHLSGVKNSSEVEIETGNEIHFSQSDFFKYKLGVFGHIHRYQVLGKNVYTGPVVTNSFDEANIVKGFIYITSPEEYQFIPFKTPETEYKHLKIDLVNKDSINFDPAKLTKLVRGKLLKVTVYARNMMQVNQAEIKTEFSKHGGTVVRFEIILCDKYAGEVDDDASLEAIDYVNYFPVFKEWIKEKGYPKETEKLILKLGVEVMTEVINAEDD